MWLRYTIATGQPIGGLSAVEPVPGFGEAVVRAPQSAVAGFTHWVPAAGGGGFFDTPTAPMLLPVCVDIHSDAGTGLTLTNLPAAVQFLANSNRHIRDIDLAMFKQVRLSARVLVAGTAASTLSVRWNGNGSVNIADYQMMAAAEVSASLAAVGFASSGWKDIVPGARGGDRLVAVRQAGGDSVADPQIGNVVVWFR